MALRVEVSCFTLLLVFPFVFRACCAVLLLFHDVLSLPTTAQNCIRALDFEFFLIASLFASNCSHSSGRIVPSLSTPCRARWDEHHVQRLEKDGILSKRNVETNGIHCSKTNSALGA